VEGLAKRLSEYVCSLIYNPTSHILVLLPGRRRADWERVFLMVK